MAKGAAGGRLLVRAAHHGLPIGPWRRGPRPGKPRGGLTPWVASVLLAAFFLHCLAWSMEVEPGAVFPPQGEAGRALPASSAAAEPQHGAAGQERLREPLEEDTGPEAHPSLLGEPGLGSGNGQGPWDETLRRAWLQALQQGGHRPVRVMVAPVPGREEWLARAVRRAGGTLAWRGQRLPLYAVQIPARRLALVLRAAAAAQSPQPVRIAVPDNPPEAVSIAGNRPADASRWAFERQVHRANLVALGMDRLRQETGVTGRGVTVALIDTGVDPAHPALARTPDGRRKLVDYADLTGQGDFTERARRAMEETQGVLEHGHNPLWAAEGDVFLTATVRPQRDRDQQVRVRWQGFSLIMPVASAGVSVRVGWLNEANVGPGGSDLNGNGTRRDRWAVAVVDAEPPAGFDTVYVDADGDLNLAEELALKPWRAGGDGPSSPSVLVLARGVGPDKPGGAEMSSAPLPDAAPQPGFAVVVTDLDPKGHLVNFGFDGNGHGTRMANILAAWEASYQGAAPGVQLMVIKALGADGRGDWEQVLAAMDYAVAHGADILHVSAENPMEVERLALTERALRAAQDRGVLPILAAGNGGPGLHTALPLPEDAALTVGGFLPDQVTALFHEPNGARMLSYSAVGPAVDGTPSPSLVGPGFTYTLVPTWQAKAWPDLMAPEEGTSVAVPYVAGAAALLTEWARRQAPDAQAADLRAVLQRTASPLPQEPAVVQGYGVPDVVRARQWLTRPGSQVQDWSIYWFDRGRSFRGVYLAGPEPGVLTLAVRHGGGKGRGVWRQVPPWAQFPGPLPYPAQSLLPVPVTYRLPPEPGLYSALVRLDDGTSLAPGLLHTLVRPVPLEAGSARMDTWVERGRVQRLFIQVPSFTTQLNLAVSVPPSFVAPGGAVSAFVYAPGGRLVLQSDGEGLIGSPENPTWDARLSNPEPGVWEVDLYFHPWTVAALGEPHLPVQVTAAAGGVHWQPEQLVISASNVGGRQWQTVGLSAFGRWAAGRVVGFGWDGPASARESADGAASPDPYREERVTVAVAAGEPQPYRFQVEEGTAFLEVRAGEASPAGASPHLYLYRIDGGAAVPVGDQSGGPVVTVAQPPPGRYYAVLEWGPAEEAAVRGGQGVQSVPLMVRRYGDSGHVQVFHRHVRVAPGEKVRVALALDLPAGASDHQGYVALLDEGQGVVAVLPVTVRRRWEALMVSAVPAEVGSFGTAGITLKVWDPITGRPRDATLQVGERVYTTGGGQVTIPWDESRPSLEVRVLGPGPAAVYHIPAPVRTPERGGSTLELQRNGG